MMQNGLRATRWFLPLALTVTASIGLVGCKDDGIKVADVPSADWNPQKFVFPKLTPGASEDRIVRIDNVGRGDLILADFKGDFSADFALYWYRGNDDEAEQNVGIEAGENVLPGRLIVAPGETLTFVLNYRPEANNAVSGALVMDSNDPDHTTIRIPIEASTGGPEINVNPTTLDFGRVAAGTEEELTVTITNIGVATLDVMGLDINGSPDFSARLGDDDPVQNNGLLADPDGDGTPGLSPGKAFDLTVIYAPEVDGPDAGELSIRSNDTDRGVVAVNLTANGASPCINVTPGSLEFPPALVGRTTARPVSIESCGGEALQITGIRLTDDTSDAYTLVDDEIAALPYVLPALSPDQAPPARTVTINFDPDEEIAYGGKLILENNDPLRPIIEVPIVGRGTINECPVAEVANDTFNSIPLDIIQLDGSASSDADGPGGKPVKYRWTVVERPDGSTAQPVESFLDPRRPADGGRADDVATPVAQFFVDLAGTYVIELHVEDQLNLIAPSEACQQAAAIITIDARPDEDVHVQMVWHTPTDRDETDGDGTDVDLHFLHPNGRGWNIAPLDCYWSNASPDWGPQGAAGNPSLDIDDTNGAGPENINLDEPEFTDVLGAQYRVGVDYYRSDDFIGARDWGPSEVTVRIFLGGVPAGEWVRVLDRTGNFWEVASIVWTANDKRSQEINRFYANGP